MNPQTFISGNESISENTWVGDPQSIGKKIDHESDDTKSLTGGASLENAKVKFAQIRFDKSSVSNINLVMVWNSWILQVYPLESTNESGTTTHSMPKACDVTRELQKPIPTLVDTGTGLEIKLDTQEGDMVVAAEYSNCTEDVKVAV